MFSIEFSESLGLLLGVLYPSYQSLKAIERPVPFEEKHWFTYWILFAGLILGEHFNPTLFYYIPFYYEWRIIWFIWLQSPTTQGAAKIYEYFIRPYILQGERSLILDVQNKTNEWKSSLNEMKNKQPMDIVMNLLEYLKTSFAVWVQVIMLFKRDYESLEGRRTLRNFVIRPPETPIQEEREERKNFNENVIDDYQASRITSDADSIHSFASQEDFTKISPRYSE